MTVHHHIDESTLLRYASGDLDEAFSVIVAAHLAMCGDCRKALRLANDIGGSLLDREEPAPLADNALERIMSGIDTAGGRIEQRTIDQDADADVPFPCAGSSATGWMRFRGSALLRACGVTGSRSMRRPRSIFCT